MALVGGFIWLFVLKIAARFMIWFIVLMIIVEVGLTLFLFIKARIIDASEAVSTLDDPEAVSAVARPTRRTRIFGWRWLFSWLCSRLSAHGRRRHGEKDKYCCWHHHGGEQGCHCNPLMTVFPIFPLLFFVLLFAWFAYVAAGLASAGLFSQALLSSASTVASDVSGSEVNITANFSLAGMSDVKGMGWSPYLLLLHFFMLLWQAQFIQNVGIITICGSPAVGTGAPQMKMERRSRRISSPSSRHCGER